MNDTKDVYDLDAVLSLLDQAPRLHVVLAAEHGASVPPPHARMTAFSGNVVDAIIHDQAVLKDRDVYAASPSPMLRLLGHQLDRWGVARARVHMDLFSV